MYTGSLKPSEYIPTVCHYQVNKMKRKDMSWFKRVALAFEEAAKVTPCDSESSGSEHSPASSLTDLSDLVNSFMERDLYGGDDVTYPTESREDNDGDDDEVEEGLEKDEPGELEKSSTSNWKTTKDELQGLFDQNQNDVDTTIILRATEKALLLAGDDGSSSDFKRRLMTQLRDNGLDAGLCKSKWEKTGRVLAGEYRYIDINMSGKRYIVEVNLAGQFQIARPTSRYASLIDIFPSIYVGKVEDLKRIVRLMCAAIKKSMKSNDLLVAPWRRNGYMQIKWIGSYRRTINAVSVNKKINCNVSNKRRLVIGFEAATAASPPSSFYCRDQSITRSSQAKIGRLAAEFCASFSQ